ncbi:glutamyl-tRNA reductase [Chlamydia pecorum]|uniref:Glutamyl-tRNA reductase n=1 Tax=Chlamydia pecorum (strain ATCC VR-628 / DSM 29919 / E58) TaxID=331635 RepID=A0AA34RCZ4_CHLPE|nr:glutamyl-tRNA reductase [Chlamydia pecorum]AEB41335.1 Glutamyl-tRNA reductase [Chlamydia pecorum E58]ETF38685.1 glutamyl-tRNA reductase [Chlamydia pecorum VR629]UFP06897.1 glutamyl-tRNA reductase [Chlamydia pecorum]
MMLGVVGVCYRNAALKDRERVIVSLAALEEDAHLAQRLLGVRGAYVLLLTCHRAELYYCSESEEAAQTALFSRISALGVQPYGYRGRACFEHLFRVTSGIESLILGETEIQGQVKRAYLKASSVRQLPFALHFLFQKALKEGKALRSRTLFPRSQVTMESLVLETLEAYGKSRASSLLFVGYSAINRKIAASLYAVGFKNIVFCSQHRITLPYRAISYEDLSFSDPYEVICFGSSQLSKPFYEIPLENLAQIPQRVVFDFTVPRTCVSQQDSRGISYFDMEFLSKKIQSQLTFNLPCMHEENLFLLSAAKKHWQIYQKKCSHVFQNAVLSSCSNFFVSC